jgi:hypothetical protein
VLWRGPRSSAALGDAGMSSTTCVDSSKTPPIWDIAANEQLCNAVYLY